MNYLKMLEKTYHQGCFSAIALDKVVLKTVLVLDDLDFPDRCQKTKKLTHPWQQKVVGRNHFSPDY